MDIIITIIFIVSSTEYSLEARKINIPCDVWYEKNITRIDKTNSNLIEGRYTAGYICGAVAPQ